MHHKLQNKKPDQSRVFYLDKPGCWTNRPYLIDFIDYPIAAKRIDPLLLKRLYLEEGLTASQIAEQIGASKQMVLVRLRRAGINKTPDSGRRSDNYRFRPPFEQRCVKGRLMTHKAEMKLVRLILHLCGNEGKNRATVARTLNRSGYCFRNGMPWTSLRVRRVFYRWNGKI